MSTDMSAFENSFKTEVAISAMPSLTIVEDPEPQLSDIMDNVLFEKIADLRDRIQDLKETIEWLKTFLKHSDDEIEDLERIRRSLQEVLDQVRARIRPIEDNKRFMRQNIKPYEQQLESSQREWLRLMAELDAQARERNKRSQIDMNTANAPWRKMALPHQFKGAYRLSSVQRGILGDKMGLGKTLQAIMSIDMLMGLGEAAKVLIFCPKPVLDGFERDFKRFSPNHFVHILNHSKKGVKSEVLDVLKFMPMGVVLTNYEVWRKDKTIIDKLIQCQFDTVILDEAHNLKDSKSFTFKGIRSIVYAENKCSSCGTLAFNSMCGKCGKQAEKFFDFCSIKNVIPMTGTSILNKPQDLFALLNLIDAMGFPSEEAFLRDYCRQQCAGCMAYKGKWSGDCDCADVDTRKWVWVFGPGGEEKLLGKLGMRFTARTRDSAGVVMPPQEVRHHQFELDEEKYPKQFEFVTALRDEARLKFAGDKEITETEVLAWLMRLRQSTIWPDAILVREFQRDSMGEKVLGPDGKAIVLREWSPSVGESVLMDEAENIIKEGLESGNRIIVFSKFKKALKEMERRLLCTDLPDDPICSVVRYDGDLNDELRKEAARDFDLTVTDPKESKFQVMLAQYDSAKVGLNLHGAQEVVLLDREWNPGMEDQAINRVRRIGSVSDSIVHILHCEGTATELIDAIIDMKARMIEGFDNQVQVTLAEQMKRYLGE